MRRRNKMLAAVTLLAIPMLPSLPRAQGPDAAQAQAGTATDAAAGVAAGNAAGALTFDVASVKQNKAGPQERPSTNIPMGPGGTFTPTGGRFSVTNISVATLIAWSYQVTGDQSLRLPPQYPSWVASERFDVEARAGGNPTKEQMEIMVQNLLAERFKLKVHHDIKQGPVYALVLAKPGKTGPQLQPHVDDGSPCTGVAPAPGAAPATPAAPVTTTSGTASGAPSGATSSARSGAASGTPSGAPPTATPARSAVAAQIPTVCGVGLQGLPPSGPARVRMGALNISPELIARFMPFLLAVGSGPDRPVIDRTGLSGTFDFSIEWTPDFGKPLPPDIQPGPTILQALQDQLGLKLEPTTGPVDLLIVDHIEEPSPN